MHIPIHGMVVDPATGKIIWSYSHPREDGTEHDILPPMLHHLDGTSESLFRPGFLLFDIGELSHEDLHRLHEDRPHIRLRKQETGEWKINRMVQVSHEDGSLEELEIPHVIDLIRQARAAARRARAAQKGTGTIQ